MATNTTTQYAAGAFVVDIPGFNFPKGGQAVNGSISITTEFLDHFVYIPQVLDARIPIKTTIEVKATGEFAGASPFMTGAKLPVVTIKSQNSFGVEELDGDFVFTLNNAYVKSVETSWNPNGWAQTTVNLEAILTPQVQQS